MRILIRKSIRQRSEEFWYNESEGSKNSERPVSAGYSGGSSKGGGDGKKDKDSSSSEFNLDEDADIMFDPKPDEKKKASLKSGGFRDYSVDKNALESMKLVYRSHDQKMAKSKNFAQAKMAALNKSREASISMSFMRGRGFKETEETPDQKLLENILDDFSLKIPLRTPNLETALVEDCKSMENQMDFGEKKAKIKSEIELGEFNSKFPKRPQLFIEKIEIQNDPSFAQSPIGIKNTTSIKLNLEKKNPLGHYCSKEKKMKANEKAKKPFVSLSSVLSSNQPKPIQKTTIKNFEPEEEELSTGRKNLFLHNSDTFVELLPKKIPVERRSKPNTESGLIHERTSALKEEALLMKGTRQEEFFPEVSSQYSGTDDQVPEMSWSNLSKKNKENYFSEYILKLNKNENTSLNNIFWSPKIMATRRAPSINAESPLGKIDGTKTQTEGNILPTTNQTTTIGSNLNRLMNQLRGHCNNSKQIETPGTPSKLNQTFSSKYSTNKSEKYSKRDHKESLNVESFQALDPTLDSDRTVTKSKNKYMQVIQSLSIQSEERMSTHTLPDSNSNGSPFNLLREGFRQKPRESRRSEGFQILPSNLPRGLDLMTNLSVGFLISEIEEIFKNHHLEPFVVV